MGPPTSRVEHREDTARRPGAAAARRCRQRRRTMDGWMDGWKRGVWMDGRVIGQRQGAHSPDRPPQESALPYSLDPT